MGIGSALKTYTICGRISILNAANLPNHDSSRLAMFLVWVSILVRMGLTFVSTSVLVVLVKVITK